MHIPGIDYIGPLPPDVQCVTVFSCGLQTGAPQPDAAKALVAFLTTPAADAVMQEARTGDRLTRLSGRFRHGLDCSHKTTFCWENVHETQ